MEDWSYQIGPPSKNKEFTYLLKECGRRRRTAEDYLSYKLTSEPWAQVS